MLHQCAGRLVIRRSLRRPRETTTTPTAAAGDGIGNRRRVMSMFPPAVAAFPVSVFSVFGSVRPMTGVAGEPSRVVGRGDLWKVSWLGSVGLVTPGTYHSCIQPRGLN